MITLDELHSATIWSKEYDFGHSMSIIYFVLHHISLRSVQNILIRVLDGWLMVVVTASPVCEL